MAKLELRLKSQEIEILIDLDKNDKDYFINLNKINNILEIPIFNLHPSKKIYTCDSKHFFQYWKYFMILRLS